MKFDRKELIAKLQEGITARAERRVTDHAKALDQWARDQDAWMAAYGDHWQQLLNALRRKLNRKQPITREDIPEKLLDSAWSATVTLKGVAKAKPTPKLDEESDRDVAARTLIALLEASTDEYVTSSGIEAMGVKLARLFA